jgi:hypothetical protein
MKETTTQIRARFQEMGINVHTTWQQSLILINHRELPVSKISLRHNYERIPIHKMADQLFCEMKIDFDEEYPSERSPEKIEGLIIHDSLVPTKKEDIETVINIIENGKDVFAKFGTYFNYKGVVIIGKHDGAFFQNGIPLYLLEIKSTKGTINEVYPSEKIQAYLYALALESMGFDTSQLLIIILKVKMNIERSNLIKAIRDYLKCGDSCPNILLDRPFIIIHQWYLSLPRIRKIQWN